MSRGSSAAPSVPEGRLDEVLGAYVSAFNNIESVCTHFFGFLARRTDFYVVDNSPHRRMGFAEGQAEDIVLRAFRAHAFRGPDGRPLPPRGGTHTSTETRGKKDGSAAGGRAETSKTPSNSAVATTAKVAATTATAAATSAGAPGTGQSGGTSSATADSGAASAALADRTPLPDGVLLQHTADGKQVPLGNGGAGAGYWWTQSLTDVTVHIAVPSLAHGIKGVKVDIARAAPYTLHVHQNGQTILSRQLPAEVRASELVWTVERMGMQELARRPIDSRVPAKAELTMCPDGTCPVLTIVADKVVHTWWRKAFDGADEPEIDATMVDSTMKVDEYDPETQAAIRKIMFEQSQKASAGVAADMPPAVAAALAAGPPGGTREVTGLDVLGSAASVALGKSSKDSSSPPSTGPSTKGHSGWVVPE